VARHASYEVSVAKAVVSGAKTECTKYGQNVGPTDFSYNLGAVSEIKCRHPRN